ncbi:MAG: hypothetical protein QM495_06090 [Lutibacter sp.]|uniref:hypothetical protein n=1 Tax=Lutibacter sp. TaxID=1925666 RepID=UPI00385F27D0
MQVKYQHIIKKWTNNQSFDEKIITLFKKVRDIPYGTIGSRNPLDVYHQNMGTCSGKHALLKALYVELGLEVKDFIVMHNFNKLPIKYPKNIQKIILENRIIDPHNFIKIKRGNQWFTVDVTWDKGLKKLGFPMNENWDGKSNLAILVAYEGKIFETVDPIALKKEFLQKLPNKNQKERIVFIKKLTKWLSSERELTK